MIIDVESLEGQIDPARGCESPTTVTQADNPPPCDSVFVQMTVLRWLDLCREINWDRIDRDAAIVYAFNHRLTNLNIADDTTINKYLEPRKKFVKQYFLDMFRSRTFAYLDLLSHHTKDVWNEYLGETVHGHNIGIFPVDVMDVMGDVYNMIIKLRRSRSVRAHEEDYQSCVQQIRSARQICDTAEPVMDRQTKCDFNQYAEWQEALILLMHMFNTKPTRTANPNEGAELICECATLFGMLYDPIVFWAGRDRSMRETCRQWTEGWVRAKGWSNWTGINPLAVIAAGESMTPISKTMSQTTTAPEMIQHQKLLDRACVWKTNQRRKKI